MSLRNDQEVFASLIPRLIDFIFTNGYTCTVGDAYRSPDVQYGHASSLHRKRLAIDLNLFRDGKYLTDSDDYRFAGEYWLTLNENCTWGGSADGNHFSAFATKYRMEF